MKMFLLSKNPLPLVLKLEIFRSLKLLDLLSQRKSQDLKNSSSEPPEAKLLLSSMTSRWFKEMTHSSTSLFILWCSRRADRSEKRL